jgi:hypothetical protein
VITDSVVSWLAGFASWIGTTFPYSPMSIPDVGMIAGYLGDLNYFLPIAEVMSAVLAVTMVGPFFLATTLLTWLAVGVVRGGNARA